MIETGLKNGCDPARFTGADHSSRSRRSRGGGTERLKGNLVLNPIRVLLSCGNAVVPALLSAVSVVVMVSVFSDEGGSLLGGISARAAPACDMDGFQPNCAGAALAGTDLSGRRLTEVDFSGADLSGADLRGADLYRADLAGADLSGADLRDTVMARSSLAGADLSNANLAEAGLRHANLTDANLTEAQLSQVDWTGADLSGATWVDGTVCEPGSIGRCVTTD